LKETISKKSPKGEIKERKARIPWLGTSLHSFQNSQPLFEGKLLRKRKWDAQKNYKE